MTMQPLTDDAYALTFDVEYPQQLSRWRTAFRPIIAVPILVLVGLLVWPNESAKMTASWGVEPWTVTLPNISYFGGFLVLPPLLMIVFRRKYPRWWFDWNGGLLKLESRLTAYLYLLRDEYPSTDEDQAVHVTVRYPDASRELNRWLPIVKPLLAIPHYIALFVLTVASLVAVVIAWFAIVITGQYPRPLFDFIVGYLRWSNRVVAYAFVLATDEYPPFRLGA
jgi:hypothetical protein